jgi:hypothetical protein
MATVVPPSYFDPQNPHPAPATASVVVAGVPRLILPSNYRRFSASIKNVGPNTVYMGPLGSVANGQGHAVGAGEVINIATPTEVWGVDSVSQSTVTYFDEMVR